MCVFARAGERESVCVFVCVSCRRETVCVCACLLVQERESVRAYACR
jgi:hypothetical protein